MLAKGEPLISVLCSSVPVLTGETCVKCNLLDGAAGAWSQSSCVATDGWVKVANDNANEGLVMSKGVAKRANAVEEHDGGEQRNLPKAVDLVVR